ncbi:hypothetical protein HMPREF9098_0802 [Kingella denitrificans ATCC 33394]|uniref:Uncharacterized protein n=1 Tax=Kingella denitrificans ATCC 33394 TaxID=888741 RepID=F0EY42_9NEIS|nr:hypothetical protein HMPREF9098_0802 [Kingella denitrificans ATCC 33394]
MSKCANKSKISNKPAAVHKSSLHPTNLSGADCFATFCYKLSQTIQNSAG